MLQGNGRHLVIWLHSISASAPGSAVRPVDIAAVGILLCRGCHLVSLIVLTHLVLDILAASEGGDVIVGICAHHGVDHGLTVIIQTVGLLVATIVIVLVHLAAVVVNILILHLGKSDGSGVRLVKVDGLGTKGQDACEGE